MENCSTDIILHHGMGTTQDERLLKALNPDYFLIDERTTVDYIEFAKKLSEFIKFYNESNQKDGNWSAFFQWESTSILTGIFLWNVGKIEEDYKIIKEEIKQVQGTDEEKQTLGKTMLQSFFTEIKAQFESHNSKVPLLDNTITAKSFLTDTAYLIVNPTLNQGILDIILDRIEKSTLTEDPIKSLISNYQFDKNVQRLIGLLFSWKQASGTSVKEQLESYAGHSPHYALYLSFLQQLQVARDEINQFTKRHLDFYYKDILNVKPTDAIPDYVHLLLESVSRPNNKPVSLPENSIFLAGKNSLGQNKYYASTSEVSLNDIKLKYFNSTFIDSKGIRSQSDFMDINGTNKIFNLFQDDLSIPTETGILIASPLFFLSSGERYIKININGSDIDAYKYDFYITGENECFQIFPDSVNFNEVTDRTTNQNEIYLHIEAEQEKVIAYNPNIHKEIIGINTTYPVLKIVPKKDTGEIDSVKKISIDVKVRNCKNFVIATDTGVVDINKPFVPFGEFPSNGNGFVICCNEFFIKKNAQLFVRINQGAAQNKFDYSQTEVMKLDGGLWRKAQPDESLSKGIDNTIPIPFYEPKDNPPTIESVSGYFRVLLEGGEKYENENFLNKFIEESKKAEGGIIEAPPRIETIYIDYDVTESSFTNQQNVIEIYQILPFGYKQIKKGVANKFNPFENLIKSGGEIYLGFENANSGDSLNLLVQLSEGSANPLKNPANLVWSFLQEENKWIKIEQNEIGDETFGLLNSGLVNYTIPDFNTQNSTVLPSGIFWIKIFVDEPDAICEFIGVHTQAFKAVLTDFENIGSQFVEHTEKETITKLYNPTTYIRKVKQPYTSFGGKVKEDDSLFYERTSEHLRHKNRAITTWDYERLILQNFPDVYRVKCLNHYRYDTYPPSKISSGYITLIPVRKSNSTEPNASWKPLVSQDIMNKIRLFISVIASPHARIMVKQPKLETIVLKFKVKYREIPGADLRLYESKLRTLIDKFLSPWAFGEQEIEFANEIEIASIIQLIDDQPYVDFITDFEVIHYYLNQNGNLETISNVKKIVPSTDYTLFVPPSLFAFPSNQVQINERIAFLQTSFKQSVSSAIKEKALQVGLQPSLALERRDFSTTGTTTLQNHSITMIKDNDNC